jgi:hypothetical protein
MGLVTQADEVFLLGELDYRVFYKTKDNPKIKICFIHCPTCGTKIQWELKLGT